MQILAPMPKNYNLSVKDKNVLSSLHSEPVLLYWNQLQWSVSFPWQESDYNNILKMVIMFTYFTVAPIHTKTTYEKIQWTEMMIRSVRFISLNLTEFNK